MPPRPNARQTAHAIARLAFAALAIAAMAYQAGGLAHAGIFQPGNFFSFFTIQSNILGAVALTGAAFVPPLRRSAGFELARTAVTLYLALTGVVFAVLLKGLQESLDTHIAWVNFVVHTLMPIVLVADWLVDPPRRRVSWRAGARLLAYPVLWFVYTLIRGSAERWYPYPFVDAGQHGYGHVFGSSVVLLAGFAVAAAVFVVAGNRRQRREPGSLRESGSSRGLEPGS